MSDDTGITAAMRTALHNRSMGRCEWCGRTDRHLEAHHRLFRSRGYGGTGHKHDGSNLVMLCGWGNTLGCHGRAHGAAEGDTEAALRAGITLRSGEDPARVPIRSVVFGMPIYLHPDGHAEFDPPRRTLPRNARRPADR
jgi:hypothetical protein